MPLVLHETVVRQPPAILRRPDHNWLEIVAVRWAAARQLATAYAAVWQTTRGNISQAIRHL